MSAPLATYYITDDRATVRDAPMGKLLRHMIRNETFQGRSAPGRSDWIMRVDDDGITLRGYVKASVCAVLDMPASVRMVDDLPKPNALGEAVDQLCSWLAFGRSRERARTCRALFGDFAAAVVNGAASQAASVMTHLLEQQQRDRAELARLEQRIAALEQARERAVGEDR